MVYRPPKHKPAPGQRPLRPSTDPLSGATSRADDLDEIVKGDDRHLVTVDESYTRGDLEDSLWLFWQRHNKNIVRVLLVICVGLIGWQGWNLYQQHLVTNLQAEYDAATMSADGLLAFAQAHPESSLGKVAVLEAADSFYKNGNFKGAADAYSKAASVWAGDEQGQRAQLGWSMALLSTNDLAGAHQHLETLYNTATTLENYRGEAAFNNAIIYAQSGDTANAATWMDHAESLTNSPAWSGQARTFREIFPLLADIKMLSGNYKPTADTSKLPGTNLQIIPATSADSAPAQSAPPAGTTASAKPAASTATPPATTAKPASTGADAPFNLNLSK